MQKKTNRKALGVIFLVMLVFSLTLISADLGKFPPNTCVNIKTILNSSYVNISSLSYPNSSLILSNIAMSKTGYTFSYNFCNTSTYGTYIYDYFDDAGNVYVNSFTIGNGDPSGNVVIFFSIIFLIIMFFLVWELIMGIGHLMNLDFDIKDLSFSWGTYFALLALYQLELFYLGSNALENWLLLFIKIGGFTHILIPIIAFIISVTVGNLKKRKFDVGMKHFKRTKMDKVGYNG